MYLFYSYFNRMSVVKKTWQSMFLLMLLLFHNGSLSACDTSGFVIDSYIDNGDGTFTVNMTILVAGDLTTDCGSTWGFYWGTDVNILDVSPPSLTSNNGTTLNAVITGMSVQWGDPTASFPIIPFVDAEAGSLTPDESFQVSILLDGQGINWSGGGQEANTCPQGGCGANPQNYEDPLPCFEPLITAVPPVPICAGDPTELSVVPNQYVDEVVWQPGGLMGTTVTVAPNETTVYTATASNVCGEFELQITVEVMPLPTIEAIDEDIEECEGLPVFMEVTPMNEDIVQWSPGGGVGNVLIETPTTSPSTYTATAINVCGQASVDITITLLPGPSIEITNDDETLCDGDTVLLESEPINADEVEWLPGGVSGDTISVSPDTTTEYTVLATNNCGVALDTVLVTVASNDTMEIMLEACEGESVLFNGIPLAAGSSSIFTFQNFVGCDSLVIVTVEELPDVNVPVALSACEGTTIQYNGETLAPGDFMEFTFTAANGCDSVESVSVIGLPNYQTPLELTACEGTTVQYGGQTLSPGDMMDFTLMAVNGCDSIISVSVTGFPVYDIDVMLQTCTGTTIPYNGQNLAPNTTTVFDLMTTNGCDSTVTVMVEELAVFTTDVELEACTGSTALYNGQQLQPNTATDFNFTTALGCDSIVTVTVNEVAVIEETVEMAACDGETVLFNGTPVLAGTSMDFNFTTSQGCDSVVTVIVDELQTYFLPLTLEACTGTSIQYNGIELFAGTTTDVNLMTVDGCDSVITVTVDEVMDVTASLNLQACPGETANFNGQQLATGSMTDFTFTSSLGCDSILTVTVDELPTYGYPVDLQACTGETVSFNGVDLPPGTMLDFNLTTVDGCDSIISVTVEELETVYEDLDFETCANTFIPYNGQQLAPGTETDFTFTSSIGCDSIVTVTVNEADLLTGTDELFACTGSTAMYNGQALASGTVTDFTLVNALGCDSVVTVTVTELDIFATPLTLQACPGSTVLYNGQQLDPNTVNDFTFTAQNGCDSIVTVTVEEVQVLTGDMELFACTGTNALFNGTPILAGTSMDFNFTTPQGCDSILTVSVTELFPQTGTEQLSACTGETAMYNGQPLLAGSITDITLIAANGCDSVVTVTVEELLSTNGAVSLQGCPGEIVMYNGQPFVAGTVNDITLVNANGCDSIVTVTVEELMATFYAISLQGCEGETLLYNGTEIVPGTSMDFTLTNANGCDSIVTVTGLSPIPVIETFESIQVCGGDPAIIFGQPVTEPGVYMESFTSLNGCDSIHAITLDVLDDFAVTFEQDITIGLNETTVLSPTVTSGGNLIYSWNPDSTLSCFDCAEPIASPQNSTTYFLTVVNDQGCVGEGSVLVVVRKEREVYVPNSFSPNDDGINDILSIFSKPGIVSNIHTFKVFSRWGESVYEFHDFMPNDPTLGWDGKHKGELLDPGVFGYFLEVEFVDGVTKLFKGDVTLIK